MSDFQTGKTFFPVCLKCPICNLILQVYFSHSLFRSRSEMYICILENSGLSNSISTVLLLGNGLILFSHACVIPLLFDITFVPWTLNLIVHTHYLTLYLDVSYGKVKVFYLLLNCCSPVIFDLLLDSWSLTLLWLITFPSLSILCTQFHNFSGFFNPETSTERSNNKYRYSIHTHRTMYSVLLPLYSELLFVFLLWKSSSAAVVLHLSSLIFNSFFLDSSNCYNIMLVMQHVQFFVMFVVPSPFSIVKHSI